MSSRYKIGFRPHCGEDLDHQAHISAWYLYGFTVMLLVFLISVAVFITRNHQTDKPAVTREKTANP